MTASDFLQRMAEASRARVSAARGREPEGRMLRRALETPAPPPLELGAFDVIAELKLRSPAAGGLAGDAFDRDEQIAAYARAGAAAVSVLTEPDEFKGSLEHLREASAQLAGSGCPAMRKDFVVDAYQLIEARAAGAGGVLVIVSIVDAATLRALLDCAAELELFVLLEAFDAADLKRIGDLETDPRRHTVLAGVNCRDLRTLRVDFERFAALAPLLPSHLPAVAESGVGSGADVRRVVELGYRLALVGSALMTTSDPAAALRGLLDAGRTAAAVRSAACS